MIRLALAITVFAANAALAASPKPGFTSSQEALTLLGSKSVLPERVEWNLPASSIHLPKSTRIFKTVPSKFAPQMEKVLRKSGSLSDDDLTKPETSNPVFATEGTRIYAVEKKGLSLTIVPARGWIRYADQSTVVINDDQIRGVPTEADLVRLSNEWIKKIGMKASNFDLSDERRREFLYGKQERTFYNRQKKSADTAVVARQIFVRRSLDGAPTVALGLTGGLWLSFGAQRKLHELEFTGRAVTPIGEWSVPSAEKIKERILQKTEVYWPIKSINPELLEGLPKDFKFIFNVEEIDLVYFEKSPDEIQEEIVPVIRILGSMKIGTQKVKAIAYTSAHPQ